MLLHSNSMAPVVVLVVAMVLVLCFIQSLAPENGQKEDPVLRQSLCGGHKDNLMAPVLVLEE